MSGPQLSAEHILAVLNRHGVEYVVIGAFAAMAQGAPLEPSYDVDLTPSRSGDNLGRLSAALSELDARIRVEDVEEGLLFSHDAASLGRVEMLNLTCRSGDFDLVFFPAAAPSGYDDLVQRSVAISVGAQTARAASLADVLKSKEEAGREKDVRALPALRKFLVQRRDRSGG